MKGQPSVSPNFYGPMERQRNFKERGLFIGPLSMSCPPFHRFIKIGTYKSLAFHRSLIKTTKTFLASSLSMTPLVCAVSVCVGVCSVCMCLCVIHKLLVSYLTSEKVCWVLSEHCGSTRCV